MLPEPGEQPSAWALVNPRPFDLRITDLWGTTPDRMFAVGLGGALLVCEAGVWKAVPSPTATNVWDIHGCDWEHVWAVSEEGLLRFDGAHWRREGPAGLDPLARVWCNGPDDVMVVQPYPPFERTRWDHFDGSVWTSGEMDLGTNHRAGEWLAGAPDGRYAAVGLHGTLALWENGAWSLFEDRRNLRLAVVAFQDVTAEGRWFAAGEHPDSDETVIVYLRGSSWYFVDRLPGSRPVDMAVSRDGVDPYVLTRTLGTNDLVLWGWPAGTLVFPHLGALAMEAFPLADGGLGEDLVLGGPWGTLLALDRRGYAVRPLTRSVPLTPTDLVAWPGGDFAARAGARILQGRSGVLTERSAPFGRTYGAFWGPAPGDLYLAADGGDVVRLRDGLPDEILPTGAGRNLLAIWGRGADDLWVGGWDMTSHYDGRAWIPAPWPLAGALVRLAGGGTDQVYAMSQSALGRWDGGAWVAAGPPGADQVHGLAVDADTGEPVAVVRLDDGGPRRVMRREGDAWADLGSPGDRARDPLALGGGEVRVLTDQGWFRHDGAGWRAEPLPVPPNGASDTVALAGTSATGIFVAVSTGGLYHLGLEEPSPWR